jgi:glucose uptake protein GlcU
MNEHQQILDAYFASLLFSVVVGIACYWKEEKKYLLMLLVGGGLLAFGSAYLNRLA